MLCEIRNSVAAKKSELESEGGAISRSFVQNRFELRSAIATNSDISNFQGSEQQNNPDFEKSLTWSGYPELNWDYTHPKRA